MPALLHIEMNTRLLEEKKNKRNITQVNPENCPFHCPLMKEFPVISYKELIHLLKNKKYQSINLNDFIKKWKNGNIIGDLDF